MGEEITEASGDLVGVSTVSRVSSSALTLLYLYERLEE